MTGKGKKRGRPPSIWRHSKAGKKFANAVLHFKFERHPVRGHAAAIRKVLQLPAFAYLKQLFPNIDAADPKLRRKAERYLEKKFQEALAFWYPPHPQYPHPKANRANYKNKKIRGTDSELGEQKTDPQLFT